MQHGSQVMFAYFLLYHIIGRFASPTSRSLLSSIGGHSPTGVDAFAEFYDDGANFGHDAV